MKARAIHNWPDRLAPASDYLRTFAHFSPNARRLLLAVICLSTSWGVFGVLFNLYLVALGHTLSYIGLVAAVTTIGQAAISPAMAWVLRHSAVRATLTVGAALQVLTLALCAVVTDEPGLVVVAALSGAAYSVTTIPLYPYMIEQAAAHERAHLFSSYYAASMLGTMLGSLLSGALPAVAAILLQIHSHQVVIEDRGGLILGAMASAVGCWLYWRLGDEARRMGSDESLPHVPEAGTPRAVLRTDVLVMLTATGFIALVIGATVPFFNIYFARLHASTATIGTIFAVSSVLCTVVAFGAPAAGRYGRLRAFSAARALTGPIFMLFGLHPGLVVAVAVYIGRGMLGTIAGALENTFAMEVLPAEARSTVASWRSFVVSAVSSVGALLAGVVVPHYGYDVVFLVGGIVTMLAAAAYFVRFSRHSTRMR